MMFHQQKAENEYERTILHGDFKTRWLRTGTPVEFMMGEKSQGIAINGMGEGWDDPS